MSVLDLTARPPAPRSHTAPPAPPGENHGGFVCGIIVVLALFIIYFVLVGKASHDTQPGSDHVKEVATNWAWMPLIALLLLGCCCSSGDGGRVTAGDVNRAIVTQAVLDRVL